MHMYHIEETSSSCCRLPTFRYVGLGNLSHPATERAVTPLEVALLLSIIIINRFVVILIERHHFSLRPVTWIYEELSASFNSFILQVCLFLASLTLIAQNL